MTPEELKNMQSDKVVDARGTSCPGPILAAKKSIVEVQVGQVMEVLASDAGTKKDLPAWCKKTGHEFLGMCEDAGDIKLFIKRTK
ncbi:sulfurtransferase TusA family protein [Desulfoscipio gibsoniae]|uniref:Putative redox protein, regulator of disulfide bond formation n=1 Tax=Desulfoscipio gibsoniae DSM 7213 TaxID=767817 RepID=R4KFA1_9FIRM|nr:sulfurtransferase TusA family protein [Desulfoscipio gibsoniae]AGL00342.1 putative redox protein, regulator of disulfide bond formation [Desulfoscipio gibsoniae DSM 7213]